MPSDSSDHRRTTTTTGKPGAPPPEPEHLPCPRCDSTNTKFCYYNNYNFSQPRHFCKGCRRYWTHGGTLRDIPVGGGSRKNAKRSRLSHHHNNSMSSHSLEFRHVAAPQTATPILIPFTEHGGALHLTESFTSLLNSTHGPGLFGFDQENGFGFGRGIWPFAGIGDNGGHGGGYGQYPVAGGGGMTWQAESGEGGGDCFSLPDLAISTPGMI